MTVAVLVNVLLMAGIVAALIHFVRIPFRLGRVERAEEVVRDARETDLSRAA